MKNLTDLRVKESGVIKGFSDESLSIKLMEMGCLPGAEVTLEFTAPFGGPLAIKVSGYHLSIRKGDASSILLED